EEAAAERAVLVLARQYPFGETVDDRQRGRTWRGYWHPALAGEQPADRRRQREDHAGTRTGAAERAGHRTRGVGFDVDTAVGAVVTDVGPSQLTVRLLDEVDGQRHAVAVALTEREVGVVTAERALVTQRTLVLLVLVLFSDVDAGGVVGSVGLDQAGGVRAHSGVQYV